MRITDVNNDPPESFRFRGIFVYGIDYNHTIDHKEQICYNLINEEKV